MASNTLDFSIDSLFGGGTDDFLFPSTNQQPNQANQKPFDDYLQRNSWNDWYPYFTPDHSFGFYQNPQVFDASYNKFSFEIQQPQAYHQARLRLYFWNFH